MKSLGNNARHRRQRASGFSLIEMMIVVALIVILASITFMSLQPLLQQQHVTNAYNITMAAMRQARDNAISQSTSYSVAFSNAAIPNTIIVAPTTTFTGDLRTATYSLPTDVQFVVVSASGSAPTAPDNYGTEANAIDFGYTASSSTGGATTIYFCPDGSAQTASNCYGMLNWDGGVVYIARPGNLMSSRALTLWGATGRIHGWRLYGKSGGYQWVRQ